jgi:uncharacterized membrane protein
LPFRADRGIIGKEAERAFGEKRPPFDWRWRAMYYALQSLSEAALLFAVIFVMTAIGVAVARRYRDRAVKDIAESSAMMSNFRELHAQGGLSDEEFRTIKTKLASELKAELKDTNNTG